MAKGCFVGVNTCFYLGLSPKWFIKTPETWNFSFFSVFICIGVDILWIEVWEMKEGIIWIKMMDNGDSE